MTYPTKFFRLNQTGSFPEVIRTVNHCISQGESVFRWQGPQTSFANPGDLFLALGGKAEVLAPSEPVELPESTVKHLLPLKPGKVALLWDKSFLWGYLAVNTLRDLGFRFDLLTAEAVRQGGLNGCQLLVVPGGWASLKSEKLGKHGREELRRFVRSGGGYLGICGGAGLALQVDEGLGLLPVARKPMAERLPNFSGSIRVRQTVSHSLWWGLQGEAPFQVWWPSQFDLLKPDKVQILGRYGDPESDFCVSDLNVCETVAACLEWEQLEKAYQINLNPERLSNEPAIIAGEYGQGRVVLSYPHLETPGDVAGNMALFNIWHDLLSSSVLECPDDSDGTKVANIVPVDEQSLEHVRAMARETEKLVALGERHNLWSWRNPWLLQWQRGVRGAEFGTIAVLLQGLVRELERTGGIASTYPKPSSLKIDAQFEKLVELWGLFRDKGRALVVEEARNLNDKKANNGEALSPQARDLRTEIFNCVRCYGSRSYGGLYRQLLDQIDSLLLGTLLADLKC
ncbi:MAG: BPL-N domain-containing protein [Deltaproteobacteria bacterium]|jgi:putative intracellular protease/amidase